MMDTLVIGAGIVGISTAYYLKLAAPELSVTLVDMGRPMELTSAHSGENYRNWWPHPVNDSFPEIVLRGAARLNPSLKTYYTRLPRNMTHYGGFYTMTDENWPLIGPMGVDGTFVVGAMSGFGTMAACAAGELCARQLLGAELPDYANALSLGRYQDQSLMAKLLAKKSRGLL